MSSDVLYVQNIQLYNDIKNGEKQNIVTKREALITEWLTFC